MKTKIVKMTPRILTFFLLLLFILSCNVFAGSGEVCLGGDIVQFRKAVSAIEKIPYNPRPIATNTQDVTGISEQESMVLFLQNFERVQISSPANGKTFFHTDPGNWPDITLVGYIAMQEGQSGIARPWIIVTHGGVGESTFVGGFLTHVANVLYANGYNVLALDRRDGLLSRCAYDQNLTPDPSNSQAAFPYGNPVEYCGNLPGIFRAQQVKGNFKANSLPSDYQAFSPGDVLAAAQFLKNEKGAAKIGALSGSMGGLNIIRAASIQNGADNDFDKGLLDALLAFSPVGDVNTVLYVANTNQFPCGMAERVRFYSTQIKGTGIRNFDVDREGAIEDYFMLLNGVNIVRELKIPVFIFYTLTEYNDHPNEGMAYKSKTDTMIHGHTMIMSLLGHFGHNWRSDPYWGDKVVLTYFKLLLAHTDSQIGDDPGFPSLGPRTNNPYIIDLKVNKRDADMLLSEESIVPFILKNCFD